MPKTKKHKKIENFSYSGRRMTEYQNINGFQALKTGIRDNKQYTGIFFHGALITPLISGTYFLEYHNNQLWAHIYDETPTNKGYILA